MNTHNTFAKNILLGFSTLAVAALSLTAPVAAARRDVPRKTEAAPKLNVMVETFEGLKFRLTLAEPAESRVLVTVRNIEGGDILYKSQLNSLNGRVFDLSPLADGTYVFEVVSGNRKFTHSFELKTQVNRVAVAKN